MPRAKGSAAVMAQRKEGKDSLDYFPTPAWCTRALMDSYLDISGSIVWEPACGEGHMARVLAEYDPKQLHATDVYDYGFGEVQDYLWPTNRFCDWTITNPPFVLAEEFIQTALDRSSAGVAIFIRTQFLETIGRHESLFSKRRPVAILQFVERCNLVKGRVDEKARTATAFCWMIWKRGENPSESRFIWIPPCRNRLSKLGDYADPKAPRDLSRA